MPFKKLHRYTLEHYPLIWNMRLYSILAVVALLHIVHFLVGYASYTNVLDMRWRQPADMFFSSEFSLFSIVGSCVVLILWLVRVFRNNAFKHFYPVSDMQMFAQYLVLFCICFLNMTYYFSYTLGYVFHARNNTNQKENIADIRVFNRMSTLLQASRESYDFKNRCYPEPFPVVMKYKVGETETEVSPSDGKYEYYYEGKDKRHYTKAQIDSILGHKQYAYLNICYDYQRISIQKQEDYYDNQHAYDRILYTNANDLRRFLNEGPEHIKQEMQAFLKICDKYNVSYKLDVEDWVKWVYNPPYFPVDYLVYSAPYDIYGSNETQIDSTVYSYNPKGYYVQTNKLQYILQNTQKAHLYSVKPVALLIFLYCSLGVSLLLFTIRTANRRIWLICLIGSALLSMLIGAFSAIIGFSGSNGIDILIFYALIIFSFLIVHLVSRNKTIAGVSLNWFAWSLPFMSGIIYGLQSALHRKERLQQLNRSVTGDYVYPSRSWVETHTEAYMLICLLVYLLIFAFLLTPLYRKWQASPEN